MGRHALALAMTALTPIGGGRYRDTRTGDIVVDDTGELDESNVVEVDFAGYDRAYDYDRRPAPQPRMNRNYDDRYVPARRRLYDYGDELDIEIGRDDEGQDDGDYGDDYGDDPNGYGDDYYGEPGENTEDNADFGARHRRRHRGRHHESRRYRHGGYEERHAMGHRPRAYGAHESDYRYWGKTGVSNTSGTVAAGAVSVTIRLEFDFRGEDITFTGSTALTLITSIKFGDRLVWDTAGTDVSVFAANAFIRGLIKGQSLRGGLDIIVNGIIPAGGGNLNVTCIGHKPIMGYCP